MTGKIGIHQMKNALSEHLGRIYVYPVQKMTLARTETY